MKIKGERNRTVATKNNKDDLGAHLGQVFYYWDFKGLQSSTCLQVMEKSGERARESLKMVKERALKIPNKVRIEERIT